MLGARADRALVTGAARGIGRATVEAFAPKDVTASLMFMSGGE
jgi:NAD(P)-dependent dehydrogenase (short-subunit alcohol dehydrogenase family)